MSASRRAKRVLGFVFTTVFAACALAALVGCSQLGINTNTQVDTGVDAVVSAGSTVTDGVLTVGVNASNSPYGGTNANNETVGLDVDVAAALADAMGLDLQIVDVSSNGKAALADKRVDVALGVTKSGSGGTVTYSDVYLNDGAALYRKSGEGDVFADGMPSAMNKVLAQTNTAASYEVQEALGVDVVKSYDTMQETFDALENGEGKFLAADAAIGDYFAHNYSDIERVNFLSSQSVTPIYAVSLSENAEVTKAVDAAIDDMTDNGVLRVIVDKWLGESGESLMPGKVQIADIPDIFEDEE